MVLGFLDSKHITSRPKWSHRVDFFIALLGNGIGFSAFSAGYLFYYFGGSVVLFSFIFCIVIFTFPTNFLLVTVGQLTGRGAIQCWDVLLPGFKGVGFACLIVTFIMCWINNLNMAYSLFYLFSAIHSSGSKLPWFSCNNTWNTRACNPRQSSHGLNYTTIGGQPMKSVTEFWMNRVRVSSHETADTFLLTGSINWLVFAAGMLGWSLACLCVICGIRVIGKALYLLVLLPIFICIAIMIKTSQLKGAYLGIQYFLMPSTDRDSFQRIIIGSLLFYLMSLFVIPTASSVSLASYNRSNRMLIVDCILLAVCAVIVVLLYNSMIFMLFGCLAVDRNENFSNVAIFSQFSIFSTLIEAFKVFSQPRLWTSLFCIMYFCSVLSLQICLMENIITSVLDIVGSHASRKRVIVATSVGILMIPLFIISCDSSGRYIMKFINESYLYSFPITFMITIIFAAVMNFGSHRIMSYVALMYNCFCCTKFLRMCWKYLIPFILLFEVFINAAHRVFSVSTIFVFEPDTWVQYTSTMSGTSTFLQMLPCSCVPIIMVAIFIHKNGNFKKRCLQLIQPSWERDQLTDVNYSKKWVRRQEAIEDENQNLLHENV